MMERRSLTLRSLVWPIFIELFLQYAIGTVDTLMVSRISDDAVAVVGISNQWFSTVILLFTAINGGAGVLVAQCIGGGRYTDARKAAALSILFTAALGLVLSIALHAGADGLSGLLQVPARMKPLAVVYMGIVGTGTIFTALSLMLGTLLRNAGDTRTPMIVTTAMNVLHIGLNYVFIYGAAGLPQLGLTGVAISTVLSHAIAAIVLMILVRSAFRAFGSLRLADFVRVDREMLKAIMRIGWPMAVGSATWSLAQMLLYTFVASLGPVPLTARTYMSTLESLPIVAGWSIGMALQIQVAHLYGAGNSLDAYRSPFRGFRIGIAAVMGITLALIPAVRPILSMFTANGEVIALCSALILFNLLYQPVKMANMAFNTALVAVGDTKYIMVTNLIFVWTVCVGLGYVLGIGQGWGLYGIYAALILDEGIRGWLVFRRWRRRQGTGLWPTEVEVQATVRGN